jgi:hypothetical protein
MIGSIAPISRVLPLDITQAVLAERLLACQRQTGNSFAVRSRFRPLHPPLQQKHISGQVIVSWFIKNELSSYED